MGGAVSRFAESRGPVAQAALRPRGDGRRAELSQKGGRATGRKLRPTGSRELPPPRAGRGAARHSKIGLFFAKSRWRRLAGVFVCRASRPRATAMRGIIKVLGLCGPSVTPGSAGLRPLGRPMPTAWSSMPLASTRITAIAVRTVFRCVASRNREVPLGIPTGFCIASGERRVELSQKGSRATGRKLRPTGSRELPPPLGDFVE